MTNLPTREECFELMEDYDFDEGLKNHSKKVNDISNYLASKLNDQGVDINLEVVDKASLLHDIGKVVSKSSPLDHGEMGKKVLEEEGFPKLGEVVEKHKMDRVRELEGWEEKVVYYADKRVKGNQVVSVNERYEDLMRRYDVPEDERVPKSSILDIERGIFEKLDISPGELKSGLSSFDNELVDEKPGVGVGIMILNSKDEVLLGLRHEEPDKADSELHGEGTWTMPGGKLDFQEGLKECAKRETMEENGLQLQNLEMISVSNDTVHDNHFVTIGFLCEDFKGDPKVREPDQIVDWKWFNINDLPDKMFPPSRKIIENYLSGSIYQGS